MDRIPIKQCRECKVLSLCREKYQQQRPPCACITVSPKLALSLSKIVHYHCKDVPHDIGLTLAEEVERQLQASGYKIKPSDITPCIHIAEGCEFHSDKFCGKRCRLYEPAV